MNITQFDKKNYILKDWKSMKILEIIKEIEKHKLNKTDKEIVKMARTQLKADWETPLIAYLNKLLRKYKK